MLVEREAPGREYSRDFLDRGMVAVIVLLLVHVALTKIDLLIRADRGYEISRLRCCFIL